MWRAWLGKGVALAGVEEKFGSLRAERPERARTLNPGSAIDAFKAARAIEADGGIVGAHGDADLGVGGGGAALGGGDVRAALEELRGYTNGDIRQRQIEWRGRNREVGEIVAGDGSDGVLELSAGDAEVDALGADGFKLGAGLIDVGSGADAAGKKPLRQIELAFEVDDRGVE